LQDVWYENLLDTKAEKVEENIRYIKLVFPVKEGKSWDGNAYNTLGTWNYTYTDVDVPLIINNNTFDSTLTVLQLDNPLLISYEHSEEQYARGVGMIYKQYTFLDYQNIQPGLEFTMQVSSYSYE